MGRMHTTGHMIDQTQNTLSLARYAAILQKQLLLLDVHKRFAFKNQLCCMRDIPS
jgi:hypothetical protein